MSNMRHQRYSLPWLLIVFCFPIASATPPVAGSDVVEIQKIKKVKKKRNSWDECKELLKKQKEKKNKNSTEKKDE